MKFFSLLTPVFNALNDGKVLRHTSAWALRVAAVIGAVAALVGALACVAAGFKTYDMLGQTGARSAGILIGALDLALVCLAIGYVQLGLCWFRAKSVFDLGETHFTVLSIVSILFRLMGELTFTIYALVGIGGCFFLWLTDLNPFQFGQMLGELPFASNASTGFVGGIEFLLSLLLIAFVSVVIFYAMAELSIVLVEIAVNTRKAPVEPAIDAEAPSIATRQQAGGSLAQAVAGAISQTCASCGSGLEPNAIFCAECGGRVS